MSAVAFDTLKLARTLRDTAHMSQEQAEGISNALAEAMSGAELATKSDIRELTAATKADFAEARATTKADIAQAKAELKADNLRFEGKVEATRAELKADLAETRAELKADNLRLETKIEAAKADILKTMSALIFSAVVVNALVIFGAVFGLAKMLGH